MEPLLEVKDLKKTYRRGRKDRIEALRGVSFTLPAGKCLGLVGESGCGKSTLCRMITGFERPSAGGLWYRGMPLQSVVRRGNIQMVFQNSLDAVNLYMDAYHIISEPLKNFFHLDRAACLAETARLMEQVGLSAQDMWKYPQQFSGGQLQRICIARALAAKPELLLLDEPLSSLDVSVQAQLLNLLTDLKGSLALTFILVSHDLEAVYYLSDAILVMYGGCLVEQLDDICELDRLCHPYTRRLLAAHGWTPEQQTSYFEDATFSGCPYCPRCPQAEEQCKYQLPPLICKEPGHYVACFQM